jgi:cytochrome c553
MRIRIGRVVFAVGVLLGAVAVYSAGEPPSWAYPSTPQGFQRAPDDGSKRRVPGSTREYTYAEIEDSFKPADWHPTDHPPMPDPVGQGRTPDVRACSWCHLPNGLGHPQSASLAGLQASYLAAQISDFSNGNRKPAVGNTIMAIISKAMTAAEVKAASSYYAALKLKPWIKVVEARTAPKTQIIEGNLRLLAMPAANEPLGRRIVEVPQDRERTRFYDSHAGFVAYVPVGSIKKGENLVTTGGATIVGGKIVAGKTVACTTCHGVDLRGMLVAPGGTTPVPALAGRSPTYIFRQLYDIQKQARKGANAALMQPVVGLLNEEEMIGIAAYLASRAP